MPPRGRPPKKGYAVAAIAANGASSTSTSSSSSIPGPSHKSTGKHKKLSSAAVTHRARDKTRGQGARLYNDPFNDERQLEAQLKRLGLYAANTLGDGSCLFRALSDQLHGTPNHHLTIRHEVCNFLLAHRDEFIAFIDDSNHSSPEDAYASHVAEMRNSATYGTQLEIVSFARMVKRKIRVIQAELVYVIGFEDESPSAKADRAAATATINNNSSRRDSKGKSKDLSGDLPDLYIVYHNWEHYSSARNISGPHTGLPCIIEIHHPTPGVDSAMSSTQQGTGEADVADLSQASQEESLILSSLRFPHRHTISEIRKLIHDSGGSWERALEVLLENEIDETESEDFNQPASPAGSGTGSPHHHSHSHSHSQTPPPPEIGITAATPRIVAIPPRSSSPSASSSTATSTTNNSQSTAATQLSDLIEVDRSKSSASPIPASTSNALKATTRRSSTTTSASTSKVRSRAASPDNDITAAESPRQRFRISREAVDAASEDTSSYGGDDVASLDVSSPSSSGSAAGEELYESVTSSVAPTPPPRTGAGPPVLPSSSQQQSQQQIHISPVKSSRFPKRKEALSASRGPTRRQRKVLVKTGQVSSIQTRSKGAISKQEESGLQREFRELYV